MHLRDRLFVCTSAVAVGLHALGLLLAATIMRAGTPLAAANERTAWLAQRPWGWSVGWSVWMLCALSLVALLTLAVVRLAGPVSTADVLPERPPALALGSAAISLGAAGAAIDLLCDALWIAVVPLLAQQGAQELFLTAERALIVGGTVTANGLYSIAVLLVTLMLPRSASRWRLVRGLGWATFASGMALAAAGLSGEPAALAAASALTILSFIAFALALAGALQERMPGPG